MSRDRFLLALAAVVVGNAIYFVLLEPRLSDWLRHRPFTVDAGLLLDFLLCLGLYLALVRVLGARRKS